MLRYLKLKTLTRVASVSAVCLLALSSPAYALEISKTIIPNDPSVTIYSLDDFVAPVRTITPQAAPQASAQPTAQNATAMTPKAAETSADSAAEAAPETGWLGALWSGRANIGASLQTGNTEQDAINADASLRAKWNDGAGDTKHRASAKAEINIENEDDETTEDNRTLKLAYDYFLNKKWFLNSTLGFEQDEIDLIDLRTDVGIGIGHQVYESDDLNLQYIFGPSYLNEEFENGDSEDSLAARWSLEYDQKIWDNLFEIFHEHELFVPTDETDGYLIDTKTGVRIPLKKGLVATGEVEFDVPNLDEAMKWAEKCPHVHYGKLEIRASAMGSV